MEDNKVVYIEMYELDEQVEDLSKATGLAKNVIRRVLLQQRRLAQGKMSLGYGYNLKGIVKIEPKEKGEETILTSSVAQAVKRPITIRTIGAYTTVEESTKLETIEDEEFM